MNIGDILLDDGDIDAAKSSIHTMRVVCATAAHDYAKAALGAASTALTNAMSGCPIAQLFRNTSEVQEYTAKSQVALEAAFSCVEMALNLEDGGEGEEEARLAYEEYLVDELKPEEVTSMLETAAGRVNMVYATLPPEPITPVMYTDPARLFKKDQSTG